ncbi:MAG: hypothetical protein ACOYEO_08720 [bacterium]|jgi:hypothetical protein
MFRAKFIHIVLVGLTLILLISGSVLAGDDEMKEVIDKFLPKEGKRTVPIGMDRNARFAWVDLDNDGNEELAVYYRDNSNIGVLLLAKEDSKWQPQDQLTGYGTKLDYVGFHDLDGDEQLEVLIGGGSAQDNKLIIYKLAGEKYKEVAQLDYHSFSIGDLEGDGALEIASIVGIEGNENVIPSVKLQVHSLIDNAYQTEYEREFAGSYPNPLLSVPSMKASKPYL